MPDQSLYIHVPFCKRACHYCDFHFSTVQKHKKEVLEAMLLELDLRKGELPDRNLCSIYFGGGTPSLLSISELNVFFDHIARYFNWGRKTEITLEANPDDLSEAYLKSLLKETPINRLSIGVQSFAEEDLRYMGRIHTAREAEEVLFKAQDLGFEKLSIDLIFGGPTTSDEIWAANLEKAASLQVQHLSCYALTVEERTALGYRVRKDLSPQPSESRAARQFEYLMAFAERQDYEPYEISNFARKGHRAIHNSLYWQGAPYLGIGPSAHSFDGHRRRRWNVANNGLYLKCLTTGQPPWEEECLTSEQRYNELVLTRLRTLEGLSAKAIQDLGENYLQHFLRQAKSLQAEKLLEEEKGWYRLSRAGRLLADFVARELFWV